MNRHRISGIAALIVVAAVALLSTISSVSTPDPVAADAPAGAFSSARAHAEIDRFATAPHPAGSVEHARVRDYLLGRLTELGFQPRQRESTSTRTDAGPLVSGRVHNIMATLPGREPTGRVLLVAHYDSAPISHGASDDGMGVATILEVARALRAEGAPRNTVELLITDGEEDHLLGAHAYVGSPDAGDRDRTVVLNLETRGTSGRVVMFETGPHNAALVPSLGDSPPLATSLSPEIYRLLPNDTDFSEFRRAGFTGMNFAVIGTSANYHTAEDNAAHASQDSLQDMGNSVLSTTRKFAGDDLGTLTAGAEATYFTVAGVLVHYPLWVSTLCTVATVCGFLLALILARRRGVLRMRSVALVAAGVPLPLLGAAAIGWFGWLVLTWLRPDYTGFLSGDPYRPTVIGAGLGLLVLAATWLWLTVVRRKRSLLEVCAGVVGWLVLLSVVMTVLLPGGAYLFTWPALAGVIGVLIATRLDEGSVWLPVATAAGGLIAAALLAPIVPVLGSTIGLAFAAGPLIVLTLVLLPVLVPAARVVRGRALVGVLTAVAVLGVATVGAGVLLDRPDTEHPAQAGLLYTVDADQHTARYVSSGLGARDWVDQYVGTEHVPLQDQFPSLVRPGGWLVGPAPMAPVPLPTLRVLDTTQAGPVREVRLRLGSEHGSARRLALFADTTTGAVEGVRLPGVDGQPPVDLPGGQNRAKATGSWQWGAIFVACPADGCEVTLRVRTPGRLRLRLLAETPVVPPSVLPHPRPEDVTSSAAWSGQTLSAKTFLV